MGPLAALSWSDTNRSDVKGGVAAEEVPKEGVGAGAPKGVDAKGSDANAGDDR